MNISGLFTISLRPLLDENSISRVNDFTGKGLSSALKNIYFGDKDDDDGDHNDSNDYYYYCRSISYSDH